MLILSRKSEETIEVLVQGTPLTIRVMKTQRGCVSLGIDAPREWSIRRGELPSPSIPATGIA